MTRRLSLWAVLIYALVFVIVFCIWWRAFLPAIMLTERMLPSSKGAFPFRLLLPFILTVGAVTLMWGLLRNRARKFTHGRIMVRCVAAVIVLATIGVSIVRSNEYLEIKQNAENLKTIGLALIMWAGDNNNMYPDNLEKLIEDGILGPVFLECNAHPTRGSGRGAEDIDPSTNGFVYYGSGIEATPKPGNLVLARTRYPSHFNGWCSILLSNISVRLVKANTEGELADRVISSGWIYPAVIKESSVPMKARNEADHHNFNKQIKDQKTIK